MMRRIVVLVALPSALFAQVSFDTISVRAQALRGGVYMLTGAGGNIGVSTGDDGTFLVDDQFAPLTPKIIAAVASITPKPIKFVVNTHWHGDHTGGNENMGMAGALVVAHQNVRKRMATEQFSEMFNWRTPASPAAALPVVTFNDTVRLHMNGDEVVVFHVASAHTDGDALVHFKRADVIHMGDTYFATGYPYIDVSSGGNVNGVIGAADRALALCGTQTIIIPGHGPVSSCAALREYRNMLVVARDRVQAEMRKGLSLDQLKAAGLTAQFDAKWGAGFVRPPVFVELLYRSLGGK